MSPYKENYNSKTVKKGGSRTPAKVMGSQGNATSVPLSPMHNKSKATKHTKFPKG